MSFLGFVWFLLNFELLSFLGEFLWGLAFQVMLLGFCFCRYCKCEMPYNPDDLMVQCEGCKDW